MDASRKQVQLTVGHAVTVELVDPTGRRTWVRAELCHHTWDPDFVTLILKSVVGHSHWTFRRNLLARGLLEPSGDGNVQVWPCLDLDGNDAVAIEFSSTGHRVLLHAKIRDLRTFLSNTG